MTALKSSYDIAIAKMKDLGIDAASSLTGKQKAMISDIKREYEAKIAEKKILLKDMDELPGEILALERKRDEKIKQVYSQGRE